MAMRRIWLTALLLSGLTVLARTAGAGQETLDSLIQAALNNNPELRAADYRVKASAFAAEASGTLPDPQVTVGFLNLPRTSPTLDKTPMSGIAVGLSQTIPWPGKLRAGTRQAHVSRDRDDVRRETIRNRIVREVAEAYYAYSYRYQAEGTIRDNLALTDAVMAVTEERYANGETSAHDVFKIQTMRSRQAIKLLKAEQRHESARLELYRIVQDSALMRNLPGYLPNREYIPASDRDMTQNPRLIDATLAIDQADAYRDQARSRYYPDIMLGIEYRIREDVPMDPVEGEDLLSFKIGLNVPLWFFKKQKNEVRASEQALLMAQENHNAVRDILTQQRENIELSLATIQNSIHQYDRAILPQARAGYEAAQIAYEVDRIDFDALLSAQMELLDVRLERLELLYHMNSQLARLDEITGFTYER